MPGYWIECSRQSGRGQCHSDDDGIQEESQEESNQDPSEVEEERDEKTLSQADQEDGAEMEAGQGASGSSTTDRITGRRVHLVHQHIQV